MATNRMGPTQSPGGLGESRSHLRVMAALSQMVLVGTNRSEGGMTRRPIHREQGSRCQRFGRRTGSGILCALGLLERGNLRTSI